jgi:hypothetical protein
MADDELPPRPRRERPLRASGRDLPDDFPADEPPAEPPPPPSVTTPPVGPPVIEFGTAFEEPERDDHVDVYFDGPTRQRRWTIAFRIILAIPHFVWLALLTFAAEIMVFVAWVAALFTRRVPSGIADFLSRVLQYQIRVYGYAYFLLTDVYPPFALEPTDYAINVETNPGEFSRAAVFFRLVLLVPGYFVSFLTLVGAQIAMTVGWLITLILGRLPTPLWEANAAVLRYQARFFAFAELLTAEQPAKLFGDKPSPSGADVSLGDPDLPERPRILRLVLSKAARRLVVVFIVLTVVIYGGLFTVAAIFGAKASEAYRKLDDSHERLGIAVTSFGTDTQRCNFGGGLECLHAADSALADAFDQFATEVEAIEFPASIDTSLLVVDARDCADALRHMAQANDQDAYGRGLREYTSAAQRFDDDYADVSFDAEYSTD